MTPAQRQELTAAQSAPIGTAKDATSELDLLEQRASQIRASIKLAGSTYNDTTSLPEGVPEDVSRTVREQAEATIAAVESASRRDLAIATARAQTIVNQLEEAASEPSLSNVPADILDGANRFLPLIQSQLTGASLPDLARRIKSAVIRDDRSELLALSMVLSPVIAERLSSPDDAGDSYELYELRDALRQVTGRWRDRSLDAALTHARTVTRTLGDLDQQIMTGNQARTGDNDVYGFLDGMR